MIYSHSESNAVRKDGRYHQNCDLHADKGQYEKWNQPQNRRWSFHHLHTIVRYGFSLRGPEFLPLKPRLLPEIEQFDSVRQLTGKSSFSALVALRGETIIYERYAADFSKTSTHTIMSISKTMMHLMVGCCIENGLIDPSMEVHEYLPEIGTGYATASVQDVLDMNVINDYSEDYSDPDTTALLQNVAMGWRLPTPNQPETSNREFLQGIQSAGTSNNTGLVNYKSANTDILGWIVERVTEKTLRQHYLDIVEAAGLELPFYMSTDRLGVPNTNGGICMTARDLARYGLIFTRDGLGIRGNKIGSAAFIHAVREQKGPFYPPPFSQLYHRNHLRTDGRWIGHGGWGGQFLLVHPESATVVVFFSVLENTSASDDAHTESIIHMAEEISGLPRL